MAHRESGLDQDNRALPLRRRCPGKCCEGGHLPAWRTQAAGTPAPSQTLQNRVLTPSASSSRATARASCAPPRLATSQHLSTCIWERTERMAGALPPRLRPYSWARIVCVGPGCVGRERVWVKKSVPAATTRRERVEGERVGVGDGRRRDMSNGKQQPSLCIDGLDGDGNSAAGEHTSSSSAIGANFSIGGPITCSAQTVEVDFSLSLWSNVRAIYSASYTCFLAVEILLVKGLRVLG
jgi:hypothetical protein